ncbi:TonB-dependent receptor [Puteibacter caeruleilacunae]|nr:TonB-dependent receptor [Puteibacter caeruleilacunae]
MKKRIFFFQLKGLVLLFMLLCGVSVNAQEIQLKGKVTDVDGEPLPGVTVTVKGTTLGIVTDMDGNYQLPVGKGKTVVFSFIGMETKEILVKANQSELNVTLQENVMDIQEVQVVAYGTQKKVTITGAVSSVDSDELLKSPNASVANALTGKVTGLSAIQVTGQPGADAPEIYIRGMGTFNDASPIYIVDGVERDFMQLDPNEIENITVLKDASATAVYGIRGANGVVIVTTKRGVMGQTSITASASMGFQQPTRLLEFADSYTYALRYNEAETNDGVAEADLRFQPHVVEAFRTGSNPLIYPNTDWLEYILKKQAFQRQGNVSLNGGSKKVKYFVSVGLLSQDGLFKTFDSDFDYNFSYKRYNYRSNIDINLTNTTKLGITLGGRVGVKNEPNGQDQMFRALYWSVPFAGPGIVDGKWIKANDVYIPGNKKEGMTPFYGRGFNNRLNHVLNMDVDLKQDLDQYVKGLKVRFKFSYNTTYSHTKTRTSSKAYYEPFFKAHLDTESDLYQQYDVIPEDKTVVFKRNAQDGTLSYGESRGKSRNWYADFGLNYNRSFGSHNVGGLLLYNQRKTYYPSQYGDIPTGVIGVVGRATYDFKTKYMAEFNIGYNGSENFASENRFGWFPAGSIGWVVTQEPFMERLGVLNYLKIRGSYGIVGNDKYKGSRFIYLQGPYDVNSGGYNFGTDNPDNQIAASELALGNPDVTWETAHKRNLGIDTYFFDSKLAINADFFWENRHDILMNRNTIPGFASYSAVPVNLGKMKNHGYEVSLKWKGQKGDFKYHIGTNLSHAKNKVLEMDEIKQPEPYMHKTGHPYLTPFGYIFDGFFTQEDIDAGNYADHKMSPKPGDMKYKDLNGDNVVDQNDVKALGYSRIPEYTLGVNAGFNYKGFDFSMSWAGATHVTRNLGEVYRRAFGATNDRSLLQYMADDRWTPETAETAKYPRLTLTGNAHNTQDSDFWVKDASYIRLKNVEVGYNFKGEFLKGIGMKSLRAYINGYNLLTFDKLKITDPESNTGTDSKYPVVKIFNIGVKANF